MYIYGRDLVAAIVRSIFIKPAMAPYKLVETQIHLQNIAPHLFTPPRRTHQPISSIAHTRSPLSTHSPIVADTNIPPVPPLLVPTHPHVDIVDPALLAAVLQAQVDSPPSPPNSHMSYSSMPLAPAPQPSIATSAPAVVSPHLSISELFDPPPAASDVSPPPSRSLSERGVILRVHQASQRYVRREREECKEEVRAAREETKAAREETKAAREETKAAREETTAEVKAVRDEAKEEIRAAREEVRAVRDEAKEEVRAAREEVRAVRDEAKEEVRAAREEVRAAREEVKVAREEVRAVREEVKVAGEGSNNALRWAVHLALGAAVVILCQHGVPHLK
ncbi:hypothetical protein OF83DRAFT_46296 [Amylostereum chailletii]|nr:hypothetical protein OF83DRAFT_46296 [Amylostereum chailletii]